MSSISKIILVALLFGLLFIIRGFEDYIFYDPLLSFFKSNYHEKPLPEVDFLKLMINMAIRFLLNTIISLSVLWVIFRKKDIVKLSALIYSVLFLLFFAFFVFLFFSSETGHFMSLFYVRRFLIQPIFLLILMPAFYFMKND